MPNDNIMAALSRFDTGGPWGYRSADVADFNSLSDTGSFGAAVTCIVRGEYQQDGVPDLNFLWGNRDPLFPNRGWAITIEDNITIPGQAAVTGRVGVGSDFTTVQYNISGSALPAFVERAMQIGLFYVSDPDKLVYLTINGSIVAASPILDDPFAASAAPVGLGISPVTNELSQAAKYVDIVACGYTYNFDAHDREDVGHFAGHAFSDERAAFGGGTIYGDIGLDWVHRYAARTLGTNLPASIVKRPTFAQLATASFPNPFGYASVPVSATWQDLGNRIGPPDGFSTLVPYNPVNLNRIGPLSDGFAVQPVLVGRKNVDWYAGGGYEFPAA